VLYYTVSQKNGACTLYLIALTKIKHYEKYLAQLIVDIRLWHVTWLSWQWLQLVLHCI